MVSPFVNIQGKAEDGPYLCPCCGFVTLGERGNYEICSVCFWEDDGQDDDDADRVRGGPNGRLSLTELGATFMPWGPVTSGAPSSCATLCRTNTRWPDITN
ncbi:CPCC family cysteine-rich protein [Streptomyces sp. NPDC001820]|uniref:CPCC family cysteine-rich protein n=1 Tax=Streptomyces sp. NPDC001820 TaxID=3364613 RepID=UPI00369401E8